MMASTITAGDARAHVWPPPARAADPVRVFDRAGLRWYSMASPTLRDDPETDPDAKDELILWNSNPTT